MTMRRSIQAAQIHGPLAGADGSWVGEFCFGADAPVFAGHFPGNPILPGVFQLELTRLMAEAVLKSPLAVREITKAKFRLPISPGETVRVELKLTDKDGAIQARASFSVGNQPAGDSILVLARTA
jgi:3-hydroxyacyl-[acyl-carrier-protein] dehydratase